VIQKGIYHVLKEQAEQNPRAAAILAPNRPPLSYFGLLHHIENTVNQLKMKGVSRNDRVAIVLPNGPEMATSFLSVASVAVSAPLNPSYCTNEFDFYLSDLNARALIIQENHDSPAREVALRHDISVIEISPRHKDLGLSPLFLS
jgi:oxalate---CoA ligase